ncbi:drug/metabolite transporter (DMT)-like permease [Ereboglobus sp. PH5-10]|uniref:DMT family transporter n=1 Tax=Ereboglobus sp. PH5-10 TaxID=2940629 RepID=UPI002407624E|nr:DMT family transporter [Ereboglobus sp. PH5-10]MDF9828424.1 drug/metabolite transporter (DMT)-like permease [Ereboglobus sp. PH5-10]
MKPPVTTSDSPAADALHKRAIALLFATALFWSLGGVLIKLVPWSPLAISSGRGFIAAAVLALVIRPRCLSFSRASLATALSYAGCTITFVAATKLTTAANAILLQHTCPVWVALLGWWLLRERATRADWIAIAATLAGIALFFADKFRADLFFGNIVAIISGVFFGLTAIFMRRQKDSSPADALILGNLISGFVGLPVLIHAPFGGTSATGWGALIALGTVQLALAYFLYARAIRHVTALEAVLIPVIEPILNPVWVMLAIGEAPAPWAIVGGVIVLGASVFRAWVAIRKSSPITHAK